MSALVLVLALLATACGSPGETGESASDGGVTTTSGATTSTTRTDDGPSGQDTSWFARFEVGDCWNDVFDDAGELVREGDPQIIPCDEPHFYEVYGIVMVEGDDFPGDDALVDLGNEQCGRDWLAYIGTEFEDTPALNGFLPRPTAAEWEAGARTMICVANYDYGRVDRSFEGIGDADPLPYDMPADAPLPDGARVWGIGDTEDGDRLASFGVRMAQEEAVAEIVARAGEAGWTLVSQTAASQSVVLVLDDGEQEYTVVVVADEEDPQDLDIAFYYPPGPLSTYPES